MKIAALADVKAHLSAYVAQCETEGPVVITRNGKAVAVLMVPNDDDDLERLLLERSPRFQAMLDRSRQSIKHGGGLSEEDFWKAVRKRAQDRKAGAAADRPPSVESTDHHARPSLARDQPAFRRRPQSHRPSSDRPKMQQKKLLEKILCQFPTTSSDHLSPKIA